jgi:SH3-like domain-containing protein
MRTLILSLALAVSLGGVAQTVSQRVNDAISQTKTKYAPDKRQIIYDVKAVYAKDSSVTITGKTSEASVKQQLFDALKAQGVKAKDELKVLPSDEWAQPRISVACLRVNPGHEAEMATQAIMGMPIRVLEKDGSWWHVQTPDGYIAWVIDNSLAPKTDAEMKAWREAKRLVVKSVYQTRAYTSAEANGVRDVVTDLVSGNIVEGSFDNVVNGRVQITLPDARVCWVDTVDVTPIEQWAAQDFDADVILNQAYSMEGTPYLWGGTSIKTLDCSGLAKVSYLANGIILMRDASQQALTGTRIEAKDWRSCQPGDLLFFGNAKTRRVTHVAIYDSNGNYVHSSGRVKRNSIDPESPDYLTTPFLHAVRINGNIGTTGITYARNHPWYF